MENLAEYLARHFYENGHLIWGHLPDKRFPKPPPIAVGIGGNPFAPPIPTRRSILGREVPRLYSAVAFLMWQHGLVMNTHVTMNWRLLGVSDGRRAVRIFTRFNHEAAKWLSVGSHDVARQRNTKRALAGGTGHYWIYVHEMGRYEGFHTHQLCVVPRDKAAAFHEWTLLALARLVKTPRAHPDAVYFSPSTVRGGFEPYLGKDERDRVARCWDWFRYLTKNLGPNWCASDNENGSQQLRHIFKPYPFVDAGDIYQVKLAGGSENIWIGKQRAAGFRSKYDSGDFSSLYDGSELEERRRRLVENDRAAEIEMVLSAIDM